MASVSKPRVGAGSLLPTQLMSSACRQNPREGREAVGRLVSGATWSSLQPPMGSFEVRDKKWTCFRARSHRTSVVLEVGSKWVYVRPDDRPGVLKYGVVIDSSRLTHGARQGTLQGEY